MKSIIQRVTHASVTVEGCVVGQIDKGYLILLGVEKTDDESVCKKLAAKIAKLRIFEDENGKTNLSISDVGGSMLIVSQFTLLADCSHGNRPSFINAGLPDEASRLYDKFCDEITNFGIKVEKGIFGADMKVDLLNDGPFTIYLDSKDLK